MPDRPRTLCAVQCDVQSVVANHPDRRHTHADSAAAVVGVGEAQIRLGLIADDLRIGQFCQQPNLPATHKASRRLIVNLTLSANQSVGERKCLRILHHLIPVTDHAQHRTVAAPHISEEVIHLAPAANLNGLALHSPVQTSQPKCIGTGRRFLNLSTQAMPGFLASSIEHTLNIRRHFYVPPKFCSRLFFFFGHYTYRKELRFANRLFNYPRYR